MGELDSFIRRIRKVDEFVELFSLMGPYHKDVIYVMPLYEEFNNSIAAHLHVKSTDAHQYLLSSSCHPKHMKSQSHTALC